MERERGKLLALDHARPKPLTDQGRVLLAEIARDLPRLWAADTTTDRDRKLLLRTLICEIVVTVNAPHRHATAEICWEGGARTQLTVKLNARGPEWHRLGEDTVELIRRLAEHHPDDQMALNDAARLLGCARQIVLHKVQRGELRATQVTNGRRKGLRIEVPDAGLDRLLNE